MLTVRGIALRTGQAVFVLLAAYTAAFAILRLLPGDPVTTMLGAAGLDQNSVTAEQLAALRARTGLDQSIFEQYLRGITGLFTGDLGVSYVTGNPVAETIVERSGGTIALALAALVLSVCIGVALACAATLTRLRALRVVLLRLPAVGVSLPSFWTGLLLVQLFSFSLGWLPATGSRTAASLILPAVTLAIPYGPIIAQLNTRGLDDVYRHDYIETARMKGLSEFRILVTHGLPNALAPALTMLALILGGLLTGTVVIETLFSRAGLGRLVQESVMNQDIPVVQAIVLLGAAVFVVVNLAVDLVYPLLDARQRGSNRIKRDDAPGEVVAA